MSMSRAVQLAAIATTNTQPSTAIQNHSRSRDEVATASSTARPTTTGVIPLLTKTTAIAAEATKLHGRCESATLSVHHRASTAGIRDRRPPGPGSAAWSTTLWGTALMAFSDTITDRTGEVRLT